MKITPVIKYPDKFKGAKLTLSPAELELISRALKICSESPAAGAIDRDRAKDMHYRIKNAMDKGSGEKRIDKRHHL